MIIFIYHKFYLLILFLYIVKMMIKSLKEKNEKLEIKSNKKIRFNYISELIKLLKFQSIKVEKEGC